MTGEGQRVLLQQTAARPAGGWRARLGSLDVPLTVEGDEITGDVGSGRVRLRRRGDALVGHWIQPRTTANASYASPLAFARDADGGYRATVEPLGSGAHIYLAITDDGHAFLREPGHNDAFYASGNGGQLAIAIPALDLVVAFHASNYNNFATWRAFVETLVPSYVIAATRRG